MKIAIIQICSKLDPLINVDKINDFIAKAKAETDIEAVFLPEVFYSMSDGTKPTPYLVEKNNEHYTRIQKMAMDNQVYLLGGSAATKLGDKVVNRSYNFAPDGELIRDYDKIHLFAVNLQGKNKTHIDESMVYSAGSHLRSFHLAGFKFGLSICFDLRFPEIFREYYTQGVNVFTVSSAFTVPTGKAHWLTLLKARAIENQSYVIASAQWGEHNEKIKTYGHSCVVDPWGDVIAECGDKEGYAICELSLERIKSIRSRMDMSPRVLT